MENSADILEGDVVVPRAAVSIEVTSTPVLSYALAHNRIPVINRLALTSDSTVRGATVRLGVRDAELRIRIVDLTLRILDVGLPWLRPCLLRSEGFVDGVRSIQPDAIVTASIFCMSL